METKNPIQVTDRLFAVLESLAETGPVTLAVLCQKLTLNKSTVHRLLSSLMHVGYVRQDPESGKYALTYKLLTLSNQMMEQLDILEIARPCIRMLSQESGETVHFVQQDGNEAIYIYKQESSQNSIRMASKVGSRIPLYCSGVGKAMMAGMKDEEIRQIWDSSDRKCLTPYTITSFEALMQVIEKVRIQGYATDDEENELGVRCIAASVTDNGVKQRYAFSISAPTTRMNDERIRDLSILILKVRDLLQRELS